MTPRTARSGCHAAGPRCRPRPGRRIRRLHPIRPSPPHRPAHWHGQTSPSALGHTLATVWPACTDRTKTPRARKCREGWHLDTEPFITPDPPGLLQANWVQHRAEAQQMQDQAEADGLATSAKI